MPSPSQEAPSPQEGLPSTALHVRSAREGNSSAWDLLAPKVEDEVRHCARGGDLPSGWELDDVVQVVLLDVFQTIGRFTTHEEHGFRPWVRTITRQRIIDLWRKARAQKRAEEVPADESALERPDPQAHPASSMVRAEEAQARLLSVMSELSDRHRRVLELREDEGLDYDAISARLGLPQPEAARYLYAYARSRRADLMREHYDSVIVG